MSKVHYVTVHFHSERWIDIQLDAIARHTPAPYEVWGCLNGIDARYNERFDHIFDIDGEHPDKLNAITDEIVDVASPDDLIVSIDGDAFPIADYVTPFRPLLERYPLIAVQRLENMGDPQPHPCFAVTTAGFWKQIDGDWSRGGVPWINDAGITRVDSGGRVMSRLKELGIEWYPLLRSNRRNLHPVLFAVYGDVVYHHGAAFRSARTSLDMWQTGNVAGRNLIAALRAKRKIARREVKNLELSEWLYSEIARDPSFVNHYFLEDAGTATVA
jgi:hypothetical protein